MAKNNSTTNDRDTGALAELSRRDFALASGGLALLPGLARGKGAGEDEQSRTSPDALSEYIENPTMIAENQTEPHVPTIPFPSVESAIAGERTSKSLDERWERSPFFRSLNGEWDFRWSLNPDEAPDDAAAVEEWDRIDVPSVWQTEGYGHAIYRNIPLDVYPYDPPNVPDEINPVGTYRRTFTVPKKWSKDRETFLQFEGVKSAYFVWVNGEYVGFDKGSMTSGEFQISEYLESGQNEIAVQVYRWSDGSYLENQDMWHFAGIFRDVYLYSTPSAHLRDYFVRTDFDDGYADAELRVDAEVANYGERDGEYALRAHLYDPDFQRVTTMEESVTVAAGESAGTTLETTVSDPEKWSAEFPNLYRIGFELVPERSNRTLEAQVDRVGFREYEIADGQVRVNGEPVEFRGVNRHEHDPERGRTATTEVIESDFELMKRFNVNAVRTSHYPNDPEFYYLADEYGLYVQDEVNAETHQNVSLVNDYPQFHPSFMDRFRRMVQRDKNHPSIFTWSTGNEAGLGPAHFDMAEYVTGEDFERGTDDFDVDEGADETRFLYHQANNGGVAPYAPIIGPRYVSPQGLIDIATDEDEERPAIMGEYNHAMGNSLGLMQAFWDAIDEYDQLQGGFVWDWVNQTLYEDLTITPDASGHGNDGALHGNPSVVDGRDGDALALSGLDDWVELYRDPSLDVTEPGLTLETVVKPREPWTGAEPLVTKGDTQYALKMADPETLQFFVYDPEDEWVDVNATVPDDWTGEWHHVAGVHTGDELRLYVDGELLASTEHSGAIAHNRYPVNVGRNAEKHGSGHGGWLSNAAFDSVRIYDRALSPGEFDADDPSGALLRLDFDEYRDEGRFRSYGVSPFCINGTIFADREPQPEMWELKKAHQPVEIEADDPASGVVSIENEFDFTNLSAFETTWRLTDGDDVLQEGSLSLDLAPNERREVTIPIGEPKLEPGAEYWLTIGVELTEDTRWAEAGHEIAFEQFEVPFDVPEPPLEAVGELPEVALADGGDTDG